MAGMNWAPLALPFQLKVALELERKFSLCISSAGMNWAHHGLGHEEEEIPPSLFPPPGDTCIVQYIMPVSTSTAEKHPPHPTNIAFNGLKTEEDDKKRDREHKKQSKNWTRVETLKLIKLRTKLEPRFSRSRRKRQLWDEIAESLQKEQLFRDAEQCRDKWEKLMAGMNWAPLALPFQLTVALELERKFGLCIPSGGIYWASLALPF